MVNVLFTESTRVDILAERRNKVLGVIFSRVFLQTSLLTVK